ncbi:SCO family protein [Marinoscillum sp. MHG1-6]|uniref:SCO family protein n=1 Tax=Marinoscillum sp. MHG1-6 TaxID=2959627 RepID=UPI0021576431|nr:SCO family protein [Marinoscillum sp. MHG1-6]
MMISCSLNKKKNFELPVLGRPEIIEKEVNGKIVKDTVEHTISDFSFVDQNGDTITNETFQNQVYIADFFFTSCPTICPIMKREMLRVYEAYENNPEVAILSHTIDPKHDSVAVLKAFAEQLGVKAEKWHFVTGNQDSIYTIGETSYMVVANDDPNAPGGYIHSGAFLLVDKKRRIRGVYDGTVPEQVDLLIADIKKLTKKNDENI